MNFFDVHPQRGVYMARNITLYKLLISCPGDITNEITMIKDAVDQFNELYSETLGITIQTKHWSKSAYAQSGGKPQALLNEQFIKDCDAAVAIFWTRFGTSTDKYGSGTEEEIEIMIKSNKQVFMYFSDKPQKPSEQNPDEYARVQAFRERYKEKGVYYTYSTDSEFKMMFFAQLSMYFLSAKRISEMSLESLPQLKMCTIDENNKICDNICIQQFVFNTDYTASDYMDTIINLIDEINKIRIEPTEGSKNANNESSGEGFLNIDMNTILYENVHLGEGVISTIKYMAEQLNIPLSESFFNIGNLRQNRFPMGGLEGSKSEKEKYRLIYSLYSAINNYLNWAPVEIAFDKIRCVKLVLVNYGTSIDEDIEISITIPKNKLMRSVDFPELQYDEMKYLSQDCDMEILFGIKETSQYQKYSYSVTEASEAYTPTTSDFLYYSPDYEESYINALKDVFCYKCFSEAENYILKIPFKYIKHNTAIAFPTSLLLKEDISEIKYSITSKNNPQIKEGVIEK